jgi:tetratricopeptide (TPR) repeat protein
MAPAMFGGNVNKAIESFQKSLALNPQQDETWIWLGLAFKKKGDTTKAREALDKALQLNPQSPFAHNASRSLSQYSLRPPLPENCPRSAGEIAVDACSH